MPLKGRLKNHRSWEDGAGLMLGLLIGLSPWLSEETAHGFAVANAAIVGVAVLMLAQLELLRARRWEEVAELACGLWLCASPFVFGYAHEQHLRFWHWALGGMVVLLALLELLQTHDERDT